MDVRIKQFMHNLTDRNPQSYGGDIKYRRHGKWSMKDGRGDER
jgi:hypothetical protein